MKLKLLLDTNVLVSGLSSRLGASFALLEAVVNKRVDFVASATLWLEYESVLKRPEIAKMHGLGASDVDDFLNALAQMVIPVELHFSWRPQLRDPGDEMVLEAAINGQVDALVTHNLADFEIAKTRFNLNVWTPARVLKQLEKQL
jgi:putative PIN family toxin of toxin-antitoxin system